MNNKQLGKKRESGGKIRTIILYLVMILFAAAGALFTIGMIAMLRHDDIIMNMAFPYGSISLLAGFAIYLLQREDKSRWSSVLGRGSKIIISLFAVIAICYVIWDISMRTPLVSDLIIIQMVQVIIIASIILFYTWRPVRERG